MQDWHTVLYSECANIYDILSPEDQFISELYVFECVCLCVANYYVGSHFILGIFNLYLQYLQHNNIVTVYTAQLLKYLLWSCCIDKHVCWFWDGRLVR